MHATLAFEMRVDNTNLTRLEVAVPIATVGCGFHAKIIKIIKIKTTFSHMYFQYWSPGFN
jgi:hypothetical protein